MPLFGAHLSIAGGLPRAVERAVATGCDVLQVFTKSVGQWRAPKSSIARDVRGLAGLVFHPSRPTSSAAYVTSGRAGVSGE